MNYTYDDWLPLVTVQVEVVHFCQVGIMRFINADPIGFVGGMNWYAYASGAEKRGHSVILIIDTRKKGVIPLFL